MNERPDPFAPDNALPPQTLAPSDPLAILNSIGEVVYTWDIPSDRLEWGPNVREVLGLPAAAVATGAAFNDLHAPDSRASRFETIMKSQLRDQGAGVRYNIQYGMRIDLPSGERAPTTWIEDTGRWFADQNGTPVRAHGVLRNFSAMRNDGQTSALAANFDPLTGTLSRTRLAEQVSRQLENAKRRHSNFAFVLLGIDQLSEINRRFGFNVGDELLAGLGLYLRSQLRVTDAIARYAGNRFALVLESCDQQKMLAAGRRLDKLISGRKFDTSAGPMSCSVRMGGLVAPTDARSVQTIFQHAEEALLTSRSRSADRFVAFEPSLALNDRKRRTQAMADAIVSALNDRRISIALQPIISSTSGQPALYEALLRLRLENGDVMSPAAIFPIAEKTGLVQLLDRRVLELALERMSADPALRLTVNVSSMTVHDIGWVDQIQALLAMHPGTAERLIIEITETCAIEDIDSTCRAISDIKALGVKVAMDDFGAGHTSFRNLRRLQVDMIKIDGAFIENLTRSADDRFFVRTLIELAKHLSIPVVAEWIENRETADLLTEWQVDYFQGDYFGAASEDTFTGHAPSQVSAA